MNIENNSQSVALKTDVNRMDDENQIQIGNWYLLDTSDESLFYTAQHDWTNNEIKVGEHGVLVCADRFESNLVVLRSNACEYRVLTKNMDSVLKDVDDLDALMMVEEALASKRVVIVQLQQQMKTLIQSLTPDKSNVSSSTDVMIATKDALVAKTTELKNVHSKQMDKIGEEIKSNVSHLSIIARYITLPASVNMNQIAEGREIIDEKIHDISIYGGLYEEENILSEGYSARDEQPIHIYQDLKFMDVECVDFYIKGGIDYRNIGKFDKWLAEPKNRNRVLPHPKSIVAIKNRKYKKGSGWSNDPNETYLYMRNGDNIKRLKTAVDIKDTLLATENVMGIESYVRMDQHKKDKFYFITENDYQAREKNISLFKPLFISSVLEAQRIEKRYLEALLAYAKGRGNAKLFINQEDNNYQEDDEEPRQEVKADLTGFDYQKALVDFELIVEKTTDKINELQGLVEKILSTNTLSHDGIYTNISYPSCSSMFDHQCKSQLGFSENEIGYITHSGEEVLFAADRDDFRKQINKVEMEYTNIVLEHGVSVSRSLYNPFEQENCLKEYLPINDDHYFFDTIKKKQWKNYKRQNELAVLIQGIIDRTSFFGYIDANLFKEGFEKTIKLVYDKKSGIYNGKMPDFKAFIEGCNEKSVTGDTFYGQAEVWAKIEEERREDYRNSGRGYHYETIHVPEFLKASKIVNKRNGKTVVVFKWQTKRDWWSQAKSKYKPHTFECDINSLINVSQYQQGDNKPFIDDPRCRELYPKWGKLIMAAENFKKSQTLDG